MPCLEILQELYGTYHTRSEKIENGKVVSLWQAIFIIFVYLFCLFSTVMLQFQCVSWSFTVFHTFDAWMWVPRIVSRSNCQGQYEELQLLGAIVMSFPGGK